MSLNSVLKNSGKFFGVKLGKTVASFGNKLASYEIKKEEFTIANDQIFFKKLNLTLPYQKAFPILEGYEDALKLIARKGVRFFKDADENILIKIDNAEFKINDEEELFILTEVFLEGTYNLISPTNKKIALIDIGMNVGVTSLFYASQAKVEKVFSFEPFTPTFNMALENIQLNETFAHKLYPNNFGLAKEDAELEVPFSMKQKGRMGLNGIPINSSVIKKHIKNHKIYLKGVNEQFQIIKESVNNNFVVCKMDCEGAEYELMDALYESGLIALPDIYLIEWHDKAPNSIVEKLVEHNYQVVSTTFKVLHSGMIYAFRN